MKKIKDNIAAIFAFIAVVLSGIAVCRTYPAPREVDFDYLGILITVLAILVAVVVVFMLYNYSTFEDRAQKMAEEITKNETENIEMRISKFNQLNFRVLGGSKLSVIYALDYLECCIIKNKYSDGE